MKKLLLFILSVSLLTCVSLSAQEVQPPMTGKTGTQLNYRGFSMRYTRWEAGLLVAAANSMTDIAAKQAEKQASITDVYARGFSPAISLTSRYRFNQMFAFCWTAGAIMLRANDKWSSDIDIINRGKSYSNTLFEGAWLAEYYLPEGEIRTKADFSLDSRDFLFFTGLAVFYHSPKVKGPIIDDFDRNLLAADYLYNNYQLAIPVGAGIKWTLDNRWILGLEANFRYTFFDYLDGFKRPFSNRNDFYFTAGVNLGLIVHSKANKTNPSEIKHTKRRNPY